MTYDGPPAIMANQVLVAKELGSCSNLTDAVEKMIMKFQTYGLDFSFVRQDPFAQHNSSLFDVQFLVRSPANPNRVISMTLFDYSKYTNTPLYFTYWLITAKRDIEGKKISLSKGQFLFHVIMRFEVHGRSFCLEATSRNPGTLIGDNMYSLLPVDWHLENPYFGEGSATGLGIAKNGQHSGWIVFTFPASPP